MGAEGEAEAGAMAQGGMEVLPTHASWTLSCRALGLPRELTHSSQLGQA